MPKKTFHVQSSPSCMWSLSVYFIERYFRDPLFSLFSCFSFSLCVFVCPTHFLFDTAYAAYRKYYDAVQQSVDLRQTSSCGAVYAESSVTGREIGGFLES